MIRALTVQKRNGTILYLQVHDVVPYLVQVIVILHKGQSLGNAVAEIDNNGELVHKSTGVWYALVRYVIPVVIVAIFAYGLRGFFA